MFQFHIVPVSETLLFRPRGEFAEQRGVSFRRVVGLPALVPQVLQKIFDERLHRGRLPPARFRPQPQTLIHGFP